MNPKLTRYIRAIRNPNKRRFAQDYADWRLGGKLGASPERSDEYKISTMARQVVRHNVNEILTGSVYG